MKLMKYRWLFFTLSALVILPGVFSLLRWGLVLGVDFAGGSVVELRFPGAERAKVLAAVDALEEDWQSNWDQGSQTLTLEGEVINREQFDQLKSQLVAGTEREAKELSFETVGPKLGQELIGKTMIGIGLAALAILAYVGIQFKDWRFGTCAIVAMFHDTLVLLGAFSLFGHFSGTVVDVLFVTAVLTTLSFSVHDTVVVFDRLRESLNRYPRQPLEVLADKAISETIVRSLNNSLTIIFMLVALFLLGGNSIRWFTVALLIGTVAGTYSSTFTAVPLLVTWSRLRRKSG